MEFQSINNMTIRFLFISWLFNVRKEIPRKSHLNLLREARNLLRPSRQSTFDELRKLCWHFLTFCLVSRTILSASELVPLISFALASFHFFVLLVVFHVLNIAQATRAFLPATKLSSNSHLDSSGFPLLGVARAICKGN